VQKDYTSSTTLGLISSILISPAAHTVNDRGDGQQTLLAVILRYLYAPYRLGDLHPIEDDSLGEAREHGGG